QGRGAPCGESFWHWALGADGGHGHAQPPFRSSRLIGAERQPTSDCRQSLQQSPKQDNDSQTQPLSMPTSMPITLHNNKVERPETAKCRRCVTVRQWLDAYVVMYPNLNPTQTLALTRQDELQAANAKH